MLLARALAEAGRHEEAINYIKDMDVKNLIIGRVSLDFTVLFLSNSLNLITRSHYVKILNVR
jgi:pentatricopeptide repeat protein